MVPSRQRCRQQAPLSIVLAVPPALCCIKSCATRRMVETAAHMVDNVLPRVQFRQWVLSMPKRVRWHLREKPEVVSGLLGVFPRAVETTVRQNSPEAPAGGRFGAVAFVHRFGSYLNSHVHFHDLVTDGVFSSDDDRTELYLTPLELLDRLASSL